MTTGPKNGNIVHSANGEPTLGMRAFVFDIRLTTLLYSVRTTALLGSAMWFQFEIPSAKGSLNNILWALVFGFATLNILALVARTLEPNRNRLSFGELLAILVVGFSICMLAWELLHIFHILPIKLPPRGQ